MPRSATRRRTAGESRPVTTIGTMPPRASSFRPWPSSVENALNDLAGCADVDAAVGEHAVDVEDRRADAAPGPPRAQQQAGREARGVGVIGLGPQMTFARIRSFELIATDQPAGAIDDEQAGDAVLLHQPARLDGERVSRTSFGQAFITSLARSARRSAPRLDQAAQVAVGEDAERRGRRRRRSR